MSSAPREVQPSQLAEEVFGDFARVHEFATASSTHRFLLVPASGSRGRLYLKTSRSTRT